MTRQGDDEWRARLAAEEPDAVFLAPSQEDTSAGVLPSGCGWFWNAFARLSAGRPRVSESVCPPGMPPMTLARDLPIPWTHVDRYAEHHGLSGEERAEFEFIVFEMDREYLMIAAEIRSGNVGAGDES